MQMGNFDEAERELQEATEKDPKNAETLANLITASLHLNKPISRYVKCVTPPALTHSRFYVDVCFTIMWISNDDPKVAETLVNLITASVHIHKPISRYVKYVTPFGEGPSPLPTLLWTIIVSSGVGFKHPCT